jgi:hypothetical protein
MKKKQHTQIKCAPHFANLKSQQDFGQIEFGYRKKVLQKVPKTQKKGKNNNRE